MSRFRDQWMPFLAGGLVVAAALGVVLLLDNAKDDGVSALTNAKREQVQATADSFDSRTSSALTSAAGLGSAPWKLTPRSRVDQRILNSYNLNPDAQSGFFLADARGRITTGVLLRQGNLGSVFSGRNWPSIRRRLAQQPAIVLPVTDHGLTTEQPVYDYVVAIRGSSPTSVRGAFVAEEAVTTTSSFDTEIARLGERAPSSAAWFFIDSRGTVVATTQDSGLGRPAEEASYGSVHDGVSDIGGRIVFVADVPSVGWRVVFREDRAQFDKPLSGPLQKVGLLLVLLLLAIGLTVVVILVRRLREAREQQKRLHELTRSQSEFISVVSHELRTPVAGILGFLQTTVDHWSELGDGDRLRTVRRAATNARRLQAMTRDVLDTESIEAGRFGYSIDHVDLVGEVQTGVDSAVEADPNRAVLFTAPSHPVFIDGDADRLQQVLVNLLDNARKNAPSDLPAEVRVELTGDATEGGPAGLVRVSVIDRGPGVAPEMRERIFDKFVRQNDSAVGGTGLGLYISRTIVEAHRGRLWCESEPGTRTAFVFELPLSPNQSPNHDPVQVPATV